MLKRILLIVLSFMTIFTSVQADAEMFVADNVTDMARWAQHYYNTKIDFADMTITKVDESLYEIVHGTQGGKVLKLMLFKTAWGTWNLGNLNLVYNGYEKTVIGGGTDWEYVLRAVNPRGNLMGFTGGNHGSEVLRSLVMYDSLTGQMLDLNVGETKYANRIVIEEETTLLLSDNIDEPYADVRRVYTVVGDTINLDCEIKFTRDIEMVQSYTAMACVNKDFSQYVSFDNALTYETCAKGITCNEYFGYAEASTVTLRGEDPSLSVTVGIYNEKDMTDNFSNMLKTFVWDISEGYNKLYFSKYDLTTFAPVKEGEIWNFATYWKVDVN